MFKPKSKNRHPYLTDTADWRFASLYKHDIKLAIAKLEHSRFFEMRQDQFQANPLGDWQARGLVHFDGEGPLIPFRMTITEPTKDNAGIGCFLIQRIQPRNDPDFPEEHKASYLELDVYIFDYGGEISAALEKAMHYAAISHKRFFHVRLGKDALDPVAAAKQIEEQQYTGNTAITRIVVGEAIQLNAPASALAWDED